MFANILGLICEAKQKFPSIRVRTLHDETHWEVPQDVYVEFIDWFHVAFDPDDAARHRLSVGGRPGKDLGGGGGVRDTGGRDGGPPAEVPWRDIPPRAGDVDFDV